jgi:ribosomal protein S18 acetylase RimI-like enzyme
MFLPGERRTISYFKRFKMEMEFPGPPSVPALPDGYYWIPWDEGLLEAHADVMFACFRDEIDSVVFPSLGDRRGCSQLMKEIRHKHGFLPGATWLLASPAGCCGSVQGLRERGDLGAIQNLGVLPAYRSQGLGSILLLKALQGFYRAGLDRALLEVTAQNEGAVRLYHRLGFRRAKTLYKAVETAGAV